MNKIWTDEKIEELYKLLQQGYRYPELCKLYAETEVRLRTLLRNNGYSSSMISNNEEV